MLCMCSFLKPLCAVSSNYIQLSSATFAAIIVFAIVNSI